VNGDPPARKRNAAATRAAILASARRAFARAGYDGVGVREIAADAGVTAMLVNRYFGSKEQLFAEVVANTMQETHLLTDAILDSPDPAAGMAKALVQVTTAGETPLDGFLITLYSASSERAAEIGRELLEQHYPKALSTVLRGKDAPQRAALLLALVSGVQVMRQMIGLSALNDVDPSTVARLLTPLFRTLIEGSA
jgi:AcrR family transcriptional regulator